MGKMLSVVGGAIAALLGIWALAAWWWSFVELLKGCIPAFLIMGGAIALFAGLSEIKDSMAAKKEEPKEEEKKEEKKEEEKKEEKKEEPKP